MKLCPECHSDSIERTSSLGLRVIICLVLVFLVPYGIFFAWIPFVFAHTFRCNICGKDGNESMLMEMDWRESDRLKEEYRALEEQLYPYIDKWFCGDENQLFKFARGRGQFLLLEVTEGNITTSRILEICHEENNKKLVIDEKLSNSFAVITTEYTIDSDVYHTYNPYNKESNEDATENLPVTRLTSFGETVLAQGEFQRFIEGNIEQMKIWLDNNGRLTEPFQVEVIVRMTGEL